MKNLQRRRARLSQATWHALGRMFGGELDVTTRWVVVVVLTGAAARSILVSFGAVWAATKLHATGTEIGLAYLASGTAATATGYLGGVLSDRYGPFRVLFGGSIAQAVVGAALALDPQRLQGLMLLAAGAAIASLSATASQAGAARTVAVPRETAFASLRVGQNLGFACGPPLGGALLLAGWTATFVGMTVAAAVTAAIVHRKLLRSTPHRTSGSSLPRARRSFGRLAALRDGRLVASFGAGVLATMVYTSEAVLLRFR